jgi:microcystin degradation protein MlrC
MRLFMAALLTETNTFAPMETSAKGGGGRLW